MITRIMAFIALGIMSAPALSSIRVADRREQKQLFRDAVVWKRPAWISESFVFDKRFNFDRGPELIGNLSLLHESEVFCLTNKDDQNLGETGMTLKFFCQLMKFDPVSNTHIPLFTKSGKRERLKVKYAYGDEENPEVYGEVLGSRLLWSLGFGADQMYPIENLNCYGCTANPFEDRRVDRSTLTLPRLFQRTAIEVKYPGEEIVFASQNRKATGELEGWTFEELMQILPSAKLQKETALKERGALLLLSIMIHHMDNKRENQRIVCPRNNKNEKCTESPIFLIHDIGASFGVKDDWGKVDYDRWIRDPIWKDPKRCVAQLNHPDLPDESVREVVIHESSRKFLADLLGGFASGPEGRKRVESLFLTAKIDKRYPSQTVKMWTDAFLKKVNEIRFPLGESGSGFACPR